MVWPSTGLLTVVSVCSEFCHRFGSSHGAVTNVWRCRPTPTSAIDTGHPTATPSCGFSDGMTTAGAWLVASFVLPGVVGTVPGED